MTFIVSALVAIILSMFLVGMSAVWEIRELNREISVLRQALQPSDEATPR